MYESTAVITQLTATNTIKITSVRGIFRDTFANTCENVTDSLSMKTLPSTTSFSSSTKSPSKYKESEPELRNIGPASQPVRWDLRKYVMAECRLWKNSFKVTITWQKFHCVLIETVIILSGFNSEWKTTENHVWNSLSGSGRKTTKDTENGNDT